MGTPAIERVVDLGGVRFRPDAPRGGQEKVKLVRGRRPPIRDALSQQFSFVASGHPEEA